MIVEVVNYKSGEYISTLQFDRMPDKDDLIFDGRDHKYYRVVGRMYNIPEGPDIRVVDGILYCAECPIIPVPSRMTK